MEPSDYVLALEREAVSFGSLLGPDDLERAVPSCPGWTLRDLAQHLGGVHRWAAHAVRHGSAEQPAVSLPPAEVRGWFEQGAADLVRTLQSCPPEQPCWTFGEPRTVRFWMRRQALETALHRADAAAALGHPVAITDRLAVDGLAEVVTMFAPRQLRLGRCEAGPERIELRCASGSTFVLDLSSGVEPRDPDAIVFGSAEALLLLLWGRIFLADQRLRVTGSWAAAQRLFDKPLTP